MKLPPSLPISALSVSLIAQIHEYKGALRSLSLLTPERLLTLRHSATLESIGAAVRLGAVQLSDSEVNYAIGMLKQRQENDFSSEAISHASVSSTSVKPYRDNVHDYAAELMAEYEIDELLLQQSSEVRVFNADEEQAAGYFEALNRVYEWVSLPRIEENHLHELHRTLLKHSKKDVWHAGKYKASGNQRSFNNPDTGTRSQLPAASPMEAPARLKSLLQWLHDERSKPTQHTLLTIASFVAGFHAIRPYQDGNARMGLLLTRLLLLQSGYSQVAYASLEAQLERDRDAYYTALDRTLAGIESSHPHWEPWTGFFLSALVDQARRLFSRLERDKEIAPTLPKLSSDIVNLAREHGRVTMADAIRITGSNRNTLKVHFRKLVHEGRLRRYGMGAGVWYQPK